MLTRAQSLVKLKIMKKAYLIPVLLFAGVNAFAQSNYDLVRYAVLPYMDKINDCYYASKPKRDGSVTVDLVIEPTGKLQSAKVNAAKTTLTDKKVQTCIVEVIKTVGFPADEYGDTQRMSFPFNFQKTEYQSGKAVRKN